MPVADLRCDLCGSRNADVPIAWTYWTTNTASSEEEAIQVGGAWFEDTSWAVCAPCAELVEKGATVELCVRALEVQYGGLLVVTIGGKVDEKAKGLMKASQAETVRVIATFMRFRELYREPVADADK